MKGDLDASHLDPVFNVWKFLYSAAIRVYLPYHVRKIELGLTLKPTNWSPYVSYTILSQFKSIIHPLMLKSFLFFRPCRKLKTSSCRKFINFDVQWPIIRFHKTLFSSLGNALLPSFDILQVTLLLQLLHESRREQENLSET